MATEPDLNAAGGDRPTPEEAARNAPLLAGYDYDRYPSSITGFTGINLQRVFVRRQAPAVRTRVGPRGNFKGAIARLSDGTLVAAACRRIDIHGLFGVHVYRSADRGLTWREIGETTLLGKEMSLTALPDDSLLLTVESTAIPGNGIRMQYHRSIDGGRTWTTDSLDGLGKPRNVLVDSDGSLLMVRPLGSAYLQRFYDAAGRDFAPNPHLELSRSRDGGRTWQSTTGHVAWSVSTFGEVSIARLPDGRLLASLRTNPPGTVGEGQQVTYLTESDDEGATWCEPWPMANIAEVQVNLLLLCDGRLLATYTNYHLPFGVCAVVSDDGGRTWSCDAPVQLALSADCYTGWPVTVELDGDPEDGAELITCYMITAYLNEPPEPKGVQRSVCEVVRWRLP